jgi:hypothetical protein
MATKFVGYVAFYYSISHKIDFWWIITLKIHAGRNYTQKVLRKSHRGNHGLKFIAVCLSVCTVEKWRYEFCCLCMVNLQSYSLCHWLSITLLQTLSINPIQPFHYICSNTYIKRAFSGDITLKVYDKRGSDVYTSVRSLFRRHIQPLHALAWSYIYFSEIHLLVLFESMNTNRTV